MADTEHITHEEPIKEKHKGKLSFKNDVSTKDKDEMLFRLFQERGWLPKDMTLG